tara:strand:+ start:1789 stop:1980 length:192 start_codon:yes stop_codon:yes gene_type:complete
MLEIETVSPAFKVCTDELDLFSLFISQRKKDKPQPRKTIGVRNLLLLIKKRKVVRRSSLRRSN